nr:hypothetical protein [Tanacetum cinerariifolium]
MQTALGKDSSNPLMADNLPKKCMVINSPCCSNEELASPKANGSCNEALAIPGQTITGKENSNLFMADSLPKPILLTFIHGYTSHALTQKVFANMRRIGKGFSGVDTPLFDSMLVPQQAQDVEDVAEDEDDVNKVSAEPILPSPTPATPPPPPQQEHITPPSPTQEHIPSPPQAQTAQPSSPQQ